jgi:hypothetical protein
LVHKSIESHDQLGPGGGVNLEVIAIGPDESSRKSIPTNLNQPGTQMWIMFVTGQAGAPAILASFPLESGFLGYQTTKHAEAEAAG